VASHKKHDLVEDSRTLADWICANGSMEESSVVDGCTS
jgi:hypothetical protein